MKLEAKPPVPLEREVQAGAIMLLWSRDWRVHRRNTGAMRAAYKSRERLVRFSEPGATDLYGATPTGHHFNLEIKRPGKRPSKRQIQWLVANNTPTTPAFWVDDLAILEKIAAHIEAGGRIEYIDWNGDFDLA